METHYDIDAIKTGLESILLLLQDSGMRSMADKVASSIKKLDQPMQLAIIGKISSSKSTLVNAILGKDELMSTGQKEVTYNVGWLKYGKPDADIIIHYKDGRPPHKKSRKEFEKYSVDTTHSEIDNISYIETYDDAEILRDISIIDTPGLDAKREKDSQNTLDFIDKVRPDAVVMLFTHAVSENTLDVVRQFNAGTSFNPLNAIGVLSKIDVLWQETIPRDKNALAIGKRMATNRKKKDLRISKTLFDLYPISALLYLASYTVTEGDILNIQVAFEKDASSFSKSLNSMPKFMSEPSSPLSESIRKGLVEKIGLYGIWLIVQRLKDSLSVSLNDIRELFLKESGALDFRKILYNHFGNRAKLIKLESIYQHLYQEINRLRGTSKNPSEKDLLSSIEQRISDLFSSFVHEHKEYEMLNRIYKGELNLDEEISQEFRNLCGEQGNSAPQKLGMPPGTDINTLKDFALSRERFWRREVALEPDPEEREWMNVMLKSYSTLRQAITTMIYQYEQAKSFLLN